MANEAEETVLDESGDMTSEAINDESALNTSVGGCQSSKGNETTS